MKRILLIVIISLTPIELFAARSHTITNLNGYPINFYMRDSVTMNLRVTNTNTGADVNLSINRVRLTFPASTLTVNNTGHIAPTGWTVTVNSATQITFDSTNSIYNITTNNFRDFLVSLTVVAGTTDSNQEYLQSSVVRYNNNRNHTLTSPITVSWYRRGLKITSIVATPDILNSGDPFTLTITVQNVSSATQTNITANPNPPAETQTGGFNPSTNSNPSIGSLAVLAIGTLIYNYTTNNNDEGTVYFTCNVRNGNNPPTTTGISTNSNVVFIGRFTANIVYSPLCPLSGETVNVTMTVTNNYTFSLSNVTPTLNVYGTATLIKLSGPTPATIATLNASGGTGTFTYSYQISGPYDATFYFSGYATGQKTSPPTGTRQSTTYTTPTSYVRAYLVDLTPKIIQSDLKNVPIKFTLYNRANSLCPMESGYNLKRVVINIPSGFNYSTGNSSYLIGNNITDINNPNYEYFLTNWNINESTNSIEFNASSASYYLETNKDAFFNIFLNQIPVVNNPTTYTFTTDVQNANNNIKTFNDSSVQITVTPIPTGYTKKPNPTKGGIRERND